MSILEVTELTVSLREKKKKHPFLKSLSFKLKEKQCLAVVGESASGKTTLCLTLLNLLDPVFNIEKGSVYINHQDLFKKQRKKISMIFQDPQSALNPLMKVGKQIYEGCRSKKRCYELLNLVELPSFFYHRYPHELSGGQRQRILIAVALSSNPEFLIADEPTTALDKQLEMQMIKLFQKIRSNLNIGLILISHNLSLVQKLADEICVLYHGTILEKTDNLLKAKHPYTQLLVRSVPKKSAELEIIPGYPPSYTERTEGCIFRPRCPFKNKKCKTTPPLFNNCACWLYEHHSNKQPDKTIQKIFI